MILESWGGLKGGVAREQVNTLNNEGGLNGTDQSKLSLQKAMMERAY